MKRFYKDVSVEPADGGFRVTLDDRPIRTQGGAAQVVPTRALAEAMAEEWRTQGEEIDPKGFALRDLADYAIAHQARHIVEHRPAGARTRGRSGRAVRRFELRAGLAGRAMGLGMASRTRPRAAARGVQARTAVCAAGAAVTRGRL